MHNTYLPLSIRALLAVLTPFQLKPSRFRVRMPRSHLELQFLPRGDAVHSGL